MTAWQSHRPLVKGNGGKGWATVYRPSAVWHKGHFFVAYVPTNKPRIHIARMDPKVSGQFENGISSPAMDDSTKLAKSLPPTTCGPALASDGETLHLVYQIEDQDDVSVKNYLLHYAYNEKNDKWTRRSNLQLGGYRPAEAISLFHSRNGLVCAVAFWEEQGGFSHPIATSFYRNESWESIQLVSESTTWEPAICEVNGTLTIIYSASNEELQLLATQYVNGSWRRAFNLPEWTRQGVSAATHRDTAEVQDVTYIAFRAKSDKITDRTDPESILLKECVGGTWGAANGSLGCKSSQTPAICVGGGYLMCVYEPEDFDSGLWFNLRPLPGYTYKVGAVICNMPAIHPVVDEDHNAPYFAKTNHPLWTRESGGAIPVAVDMQQDNIEFAVHIEPDLGKKRARLGLFDNEEPDKFRVKLDITIPDFHSTLEVSSSADELTSMGPIICKLKIEKGRFFSGISWDNQPWGFQTEACKLAITHNQNEVESLQIALEIYAVSPHIHPYLAIEGLPADLLRFALLPIFRLLVEYPEAEDYPSLATLNVHKNTGFKYDIYHGYYSFCAGAGYSFNLEKFLTYWRAVHTKEGERQVALTFLHHQPLLNCIDCTAITSVCIGLGHTSVEDRATHIPHFAYPVGWIQPTSLIGVVGKNTNNPFFRGIEKLRYIKDKDDQVLTDLKASWSSFTKHIFLEYRGKIYDACAGPVLGIPTLERYFKQTIEYGSDKLPAEFKSDLFERNKVSDDGKTTTPILDKDGKKEKFHYPTNPCESSKYTRSHNMTNEHSGFLGGVEKHIFDMANFKSDESQEYPVSENLRYQSVKHLDSRLKENLATIKKYSNIKDLFSVPVLRPQDGETPKMLGQMEYGFTTDSDGAPAKLHLVMHIGASPKEAEASFMSQKETLTNLDSLTISTSVGDLKAAMSQHGIDDKKSVLSTLLTLVHYESFWFTISTSGLMKSDIDTIVKLLVESLKQVPPSDPSPDYNFGLEGEPDENYNLKLNSPPTIIKLRTHNLLDWDWVHSTGAVFLRRWWFDGETEDHVKYLNLEVIPMSIGSCTIKFTFHDFFFTKHYSDMTFVVT